MLLALLTLRAPLAPVALVHASSKAVTTSVSLAHLNRLKDVIQTPSGPLPVWYVYATPSATGYRPVEAAGEGISCVDDVARALIVYLEHYELTGDPVSLAHARDAISFLAYMRQDDGTYANFVDRQGNRNLTGITSRPGINWWMARAMWGLAKARTVFASVDPDYARWIDELLLPSVERLARAVEAETRGDVTRPATIGGGNDVSAIFLMAVSLLHAADVSLPPGTKDDSPAAQPDLERIATALALGLRAAQGGDAGTPPYRAVVPNPRAPAIWTGWGSHGMEALATAGLVFNRPEWLSWAAEIAHALGSYLVAGPGSLAALGPAPIRFPQIAYDLSPLVRGLELLHRAKASAPPTEPPTPEEPPADAPSTEYLYSDLAFLAASWLFGNNPAGEPIHHPPSGRTYDGIDGDRWDGPGRINYSSGAESTIEGLSILLALERINIASERIIRGVPGQTPTRGLVRTAALSHSTGEGPMVVEAESFVRPAYGRVEIRREGHLAGSRPSGDGYILLDDGAEVTLPLPSALIPGQSYRLDIVHGGARSNPATLYVLAGEELLATIHLGRDARGDRLRTTFAGELSPGRDLSLLRIYVEGGPLVLDAVTLHPVVMWRELVGTEGRIIALRNMTDRTQPFTLPSRDAEGLAGLQVRLYDQDGKLVEFSGLHDDAPSERLAARSGTLQVPPYGFGFVALHLGKPPTSNPESS